MCIRDRIKNADKIYREQKFTIAVPLGELNSDVPKEFLSLIHIFLKRLTAKKSRGSYMSF